MQNGEHYRQGGVECIDAIRAALTPEEFRGFCKGNVLKYIWREHHKGGDDDMRKALDYMRLLVDAIVAAESAPEPPEYASEPEPTEEPQEPAKADTEPQEAAEKPQANAGTFLCRKCGQAKLRSEFYASSKTECKECASARVTKRNREAAAAKRERQASEVPPVSHERKGSAGDSDASGHIKLPQSSEPFYAEQRRAEAEHEAKRLREVLAR